MARRPSPLQTIVYMRVLETGEGKHVVHLPLSICFYWVQDMFVKIRIVLYGTMSTILAPPIHHTIVKIFTITTLEKSVSIRFNKLENVLTLLLQK